MAIAAVCTMGSPANAAAQSATVTQIRESAARGIAAIQVAQRASQKTQSCAGTCHLQGYGSMAVRAAVDHGIPVDDATARADATRAFARVATDLTSAIERNGLTEPAMNGALFLVAGHAVGLRPTLATAALARALALQQQPDGQWLAVFTRPPSNASRFTFTAIGMRAMQLYGHTSQRADVAARVARARSWLESNAPRHTEDRTYQLLGLSWAGRTPRQLAAKARALVAEQQDDGGWTSLAGRPSDAYATGQALVALHDAAGMSPQDEAWRRGIAFLLRTQADDGTWHVRTRLPPWVSPPYYESGYPYGRDQFISVAGASWAVMALTRALGPAGRPDRLPLDDLAGTTHEPWTETAIFDSTADLKRLLDEGLDPNVVSAAGRIPLLSMVVPDLEKARLLVSRGVDVDARSQARYSPHIRGMSMCSASCPVRARPFMPRPTPSAATR